MQCVRNLFRLLHGRRRRDGARVTVVSQLGPLLKESLSPLSIGSPMHFPQDDLFYLITDFVVEWFYSIKEGSSR